MSNIVITNSSDFEKIIEQIDVSSKKIEEIFKDEIKNIENINKTDIWTGKAQESIYMKHKELEKNFQPIEETLQIYLSFLRNTLNSYKKLEQNIISNIDNNNTNLDVNS